jgi:hypothetical protein
MGDILRRLVRGNQKNKILCCWGCIVTNGIRVITQHEMEGHAQAHEGHQREFEFGSKLQLSMILQE